MCECVLTICWCHLCCVFEGVCLSVCGISLGMDCVIPQTKIFRKCWRWKKVRWYGVAWRSGTCGKASKTARLTLLVKIWLVISLPFCGLWVFYHCTRTIAGDFDLPTRSIAIHMHNNWFTTSQSLIKFVSALNDWVKLMELGACTNSFSGTKVHSRIYSDKVAINRHHLLATSGQKWSIIINGINRPPASCQIDKIECHTPSTYEVWAGEMRVYLIVAHSRLMGPYMFWHI